MMYKHSLFFRLVATAAAAELWIQSSREDTLYPFVEFDNRTGTEYGFYTVEQLSSEEQHAIVLATSPYQYAFNVEG